MRRIFGYIRLTIKEQNDNTYMARLLEAGVPENQIYIEKITNTNSDCPSLRRMIDSFAVSILTPLWFIYLRRV